MSGPQSGRLPGADELLLKCLHENASAGEVNDAAAILKKLGKDLAARMADELEDEIGGSLTLEHSAHENGTLNALHTRLGPASAVAVYADEATPERTCVLWMDMALVSSLSTVFMGGEPLPPEVGRSSLTGVEMSFFRMLAENLAAAISAVSGREIPMPQIGLGPMVDMTTLTGIHADLFRLNGRCGEAVRPVCVALTGISLDGLAVTSETQRRNVEMLKRLGVRAEFLVNLNDMTLRDIGRLVPGSVIPIPAQALRDCEISVGGRRVLAGQCGQAGGQLSVRINSANGARTNNSGAMR
ncbi:FliM/FliN family flagellar motor C-terminal domain-containing protein [Zhengella sp. ZM62]|uniref:FliM/FliN family flagellar motor C-terminal domain-containing protein n=1 Tax=Zhengella sedimenti TaxID=3390035 RepID=UPI003976788A